VTEECSEGVAKIMKVARLVKFFEKANASVDAQAFGCGELTGLMVIKKYDVGMEFFCQEYGAEFSGAEGMAFTRS
jgi:hypothetical protein